MIVSFHEKVASLNLEKVERLITKMEIAPSIEDVTILAGITHKIYSSYFHFYRSTVSEHIDEISSFLYKDKMVNVLLVRVPGKTPESVRFDSKPFSDFIELIAPPGVLEHTGFAISYDEIVNEERERKRRNKGSVSPKA